MMVRATVNKESKIAAMKHTRQYPFCGKFLSRKWLLPALYQVIKPAF